MQKEVKIKTKDNKVIYGTQDTVAKKSETLVIFVKDLAKEMLVPLKVICAGKGKLIKAGKEYYQYAAGPKEFALIKNAGHNFNEPSTAEDLYKETYAFIKK